MPPHLRLLYPIKAKREGQGGRGTPRRGGHGRGALLPYLWHDLGAELLAAPGHGDHSGPALRSGDGPARRAPPPADGVSRRPPPVLRAVEPRETAAHGPALHPDLHQGGDGPATGGAAPL